MRAHIASVPDGEYVFSSYMDSDGVDDAPLEVCARVTVEGSDLSVDFSDSSPLCRGPVNSVWATTLASVYCAIKHIFPDVPINAGCFRPIAVMPPHGTFLYAEYPRAGLGLRGGDGAADHGGGVWRHGRGHAGTHVRAPAGTSGNFSLGGEDPAEGRRYVMYIFSGGGYGGWVGGRRPHQRLFVCRHFQDPAGGNPGAALPDPVRGVRAARGLRRRRTAPGRIRRELPRAPAQGRGEGVLHDGPRPHRSAWARGRPARRLQSNRSPPRQCGGRASPSLQG